MNFLPIDLDLRRLNRKTYVVIYPINVYRKTSMGRNPQTGEQIKIKGRNAITFKASKTIV